MAGKIQNQAEMIGDEELMAFLRKLKNAAKKKTLVEGGLRGAAGIIVRQARANARARGLGKNVPRAIRAAKVKRGRAGQYGIKFGFIWTRWRKEAFYAWFFEYGTVSPRVSRRRGKLLRFKDKSGQWVSTEAVSGISPKPFWRPALDLKKDEAGKKMMIEMKKSLVRFVNREYKKIDIH